MAVNEQTLAPITLGLPLPPRSDSDASCLLPHMVRRLPLWAPPPLPTRHMPIIPRLPINLAVDQISVLLRPEPPPQYSTPAASVAGSVHYLCTHCTSEHHAQHTPPRPYSLQRRPQAPVVTHPLIARPAGIALVLESPRSLGNP